MNDSAVALSRFERLWLAETVRRREEGAGLLDDMPILPVLRASAEDLPGRILRRAEWLGGRHGWRDAILLWRRRTRQIVAAAALFVFVAGFGAVTGTIGDGSRPINVVWALGGLLGPHLFALLLWCGGFAAGRGAGEGGGLLGSLCVRLAGRLQGKALRGELLPALGGLLGRDGLARWGFGGLSHLLWLAALAGAGCGLLAALALRRYGFVWETTILSADTFVALVEALGRAPALLGVAVPDAATIAAGGQSVAGDEASRRAWSSWLVGCLLVYGLVPRALLALVCTALWRHRVARRVPDLALPGYARLRARLAPPSERLGVHDAAPDAMPPAPRRAAAAAGDAAAVVFALELGEDLGWPPALPPGVRDGGRLDGRSERREALAALARQVPRRLLVACDARRSPDRGSVNLIAELASHAADTGVWLLGPAASADDARAARAAYWHEALAAAGWPATRVFDTGAAAFGWLERGDG